MEHENYKVLAAPLFCLIWHHNSSFLELDEVFARPLYWWLKKLQHT